MLETSKAFTLPISPAGKARRLAKSPLTPPLLCGRSRGGGSPGFMFAGVKRKGENLKG